MRIKVLASCCILAATAAAQQPASTLTSDPVYSKNCAKCHGKTAEGRHFGGPSLVKSKMSGDQVKEIIANGKGGMPKFAGKLTDDQISSLATEIKALSANPPLN